MKIKRYRQTTCETCLPVCLLLLSGQEISSRKEMELFIEGIQRDRESYSLGIIDFFVKKYGFEVEIYVDNKYFWKFSRKRIKNKKIHLRYKCIIPEFIHNQSLPYILFIDINFLGVYSHAPHFIIVEFQDNEKYLIFDPWSGRRRKINKEIIWKGVESLKSYLKFCPLLIKVKK